MKKNSNKIVIESLGLPLLNDFDDLVKKLGLSPQLVYCLTRYKSKEKYHTFFIDKKCGAKRKIYAPTLSLKIVQRWILKNILYKIKISQHSYGFVQRKGSPLKQCAEKHKNNLYILKVDLKDFYPSIKRKDVYYIFYNIGYSTEVSNLITNICFAENELPQGAVTSAYIANLVCRKLDMRIAGYCDKKNVIYTRYADDLTFSCDDRGMLKKIYNMVKKIVEDEGFALNDRKTIFMTPKNHKKIVGITVNDGMIKASKKLKRNIRAMLYWQIKNADYTMNDKIRGYIAYVDSIEQNYREKCVKYLEKLSESRLCLNSVVVKAYNSNKIYPELPDMCLKKEADFNDIDILNVFS